MKFLFARSLSVIFVSGLVSCAPGLGANLSVNGIFSEAESQGENIPELGILRVVEVLDLRETKTVGVIDGRNIPPATDVSTAFQQALERAFRSRGVRVALFDGVKIRAEIVRWKVAVSPNFPSSKAEAVAAINLAVLGSNDQRQYFGSYSGLSEIQDPFLSQTEVEDALAAAMRYAIQEASQDEKLISLIRRSQ